MEYHLEVLGSCEGEFFFFAWEVSWSRILTIDQLKKEGLEYPKYMLLM